MRYLTPACRPLGDAICDGYDYAEDAPGTPCECPCHGAWDLPDTIPGVRDWHDRYHGVEVKRQVREGLRPLVGDTIADGHPTG